MWIRTKDNEVLEVKNFVCKNGEPIEFIWTGNYKTYDDGSATIEAKKFSRSDVEKYGEKIEDTCAAFEGVINWFQTLPNIYSKCSYDKFDHELDEGFVDEIYGCYVKEISDFEAEFIAYCKYNRVKRCFEQIEPKRT